MIIYLIRHGETTGDLEDRYGGFYDDRLSPHGFDQSSKLAEKLKDKGVAVVYHSDLLRATLTARVLGEKLGIDTLMHKDIRERNHYGILTGMIASEASQQFPDEVKKLKDNPLYHDIKDSEPYDVFRERVIRGFEQIVDTQYSAIAIVTHGGPIKCIIREVLKLGELKDLGDCAIIEIEKKGVEYKILSMDGAELD